MNYLQIFADKEALLDPFDDAERGRLLTAMMAYALHGQLIELTGNERYIWPVFRQMIDQSREALMKKQAGGRARAEAYEQHAQSSSSTIQQEPADEQHTSAQDIASQQNQAGDQHTSAQCHINQESRIKNQESGVKNDGEKRARAKAARFSPPTPDEVHAYADENGMSNVDANRFCDFYASKGWRVGSQPMKDWRAAVRNWNARDSQTSSKPPARAPAVKMVREQMYNQREYTDDDSLPDWMLNKMSELGISPHTVVAED